MYQIKELSQLVGLSPESIRHYERIGILPAVARAENGYRVYAEDDVERLRFIYRARQLDFSLDNIAEILAFRENGTQPCAYVQQLIAEKILEVKATIRNLEILHKELIELHQTSQQLHTDIATNTVCQIIDSFHKENG